MEQGVTQLKIHVHLIEGPKSQVGQLQSLRDSIDEEGGWSERDRRTGRMRAHTVDLGIRFERQRDSASL